MKNFKKILSLVLAAVLLVVLSVGATVAYLTAEAGPVENTFTVGDISIGLEEEVDTEGAAEVNPSTEGADYTNIMPGDKLIKVPTVENDGPNPAYVAMSVTVNNLSEIMKTITDQAALDKVFESWDLLYTEDGFLTVNRPIDDILLHVDAATTDAAAASNWFEYDVEEDKIVFTYYLHLDPGESFTPFEGLNVPAEFNRDQLAMFKDLNIKVEASAIQADNMITDRFAFAQLHSESGKDVSIPETIEVAGSDKAALVSAINEAEDGDIVVLTEDLTVAGYPAANKLVIEKAIVLDLNGHTLTTESGWGGIDAKGGCTIRNGIINHTGNTAAIKAFQVEAIENVTINVTQTEGKVKGGIVVQEGAGCYVGSIKNVIITGATNGIETYRCGSRNDLAIDYMENVTIDATDTGILLSAPIGKVVNCNIEGDKIGVNMYLYGAYSVSMELVDSTVTGATGIYAHDEVNLTNPGSLTLTYDAATVINGGITQEFEAEVADRVSITQN